MVSKQRIRKSFAVLAASAALLMGVSLSAGADSTDQGAYSEIANPIASQEARNLYYYLQSQGAQSGFVVGAMDTSITSAYPNGNNYDLINETFGVRPGVYSTRYYWTSGWDTTWPDTDSMEKPSGIGFALEQEDSENGAMAAKAINDVLYNHYKDGAILLIHADSMEPKAVGALLASKGLVPEAATKDTDYDDAIIYIDKSNPNRDQEATDLFWSYVEQWADALEDLESRGVGAYLFRPFVEMNSKDFYGCTEEGYAAFKRVWQQLYDYFYNERQLKGCLLTFAPADYNYYSQSAELFYPGNEYVDVLAPTRYTDGEGNIDPSTRSNYAWMSTTGKPVGFSEFSVRTGDWTIAAGAPVGDWSYALNVLLDSYPKLSLVNTWAGTAYSLYPPDASGGGNNNGEYFLKSPYTIMADELPDFKAASFSMPGLVQFYAGETYTGGYTGWNATGNFSLQDLDEAGVDLSAVKSIALQKGFGLVFYSQENGNGTAYPYLESIPDFEKLGLADKAKSLRVFEISDNVALLKDITASAGTQDDIWRANDGKLSRWMADDASTSWLTIDLGSTYLINRWVVQHAGVAGEDAAYNTSAFRIQSSDDGESWATVSTVVGNIDNITEETVPSFTARYVRLLIDKPNSTANEKNRSCIAEIELYGLAYEAQEQTSTVVTEPPAQNGGEEDGLPESSPPTESAGPEPEPTEETAPETSTAVTSGTQPSGDESEVTEAGSGEGGGNSGLVIGICVAGGVILLAAVVIAIWLVRRKKAQV